jgi:hypothetical protein
MVKPDAAIFLHFGLPGVLMKMPASLRALLFATFLTL